MNAQSARKPVSIGICAFCKAQVAKNKMTQHLKFCKQRLAAIAVLEAQSQQPKTRLFHILAEGRYNSQYWLHFEVPASASLWYIDDFLKAMWVDDLDHLSGFTINGTNYGNDYPDDYFSFSGEEEEEEEELSEEEIAQEIKKLIDKVTSRLEKLPIFELDFQVPVDLTNMRSFLATWVAEIKKPRSVDELVGFLKEERIRLNKEEAALWKNDDPNVSPAVKHVQYSILGYQKMVVGTLIDEIEDRSLEVPLAKVLKVGQKFSYIYDYGSSTYINLKVVGEREGIVQDEKDIVQLLAHNVAPEFSCVECGKPATQVKVDYYTDSIADSAYCDECAEKNLDEGESLPIVNSPRVGVL